MLPGYASAWQVKNASWDMFTVMFSGGETINGGPASRNERQNRFSSDLFQFIQGWKAIMLISSELLIFAECSCVMLNHKIFLESRYSAIHCPRYSAMLSFSVKNKDTFTQ